MLRKNSLNLSVLFCLCLPPALMAVENAASHVPNLTVVQIVEKHVAARGGMQAWRTVQAMSMSGKMDAGSGDSVARSERAARGAMGAASRKVRAGTASASGKGAAGTQVQLPFVLQIKGPTKSRLEIEFAGKTALQVYDGTNGWKVRPFLNRNEVEPFTAEEAKEAQGKKNLDIPLFDYAAKGTKLTLEGAEPVEGRDAYKLKLTMKNGAVQHIWIDAQSFLDVKVEGIPRKMDGRMHNVWVYQRDFRAVDGIKLPFLVETAVEGYPDTHKMVIEKVALNPKLDDAMFAKPRV